MILGLHNLHVMIRLWEKNFYFLELMHGPWGGGSQKFFHRGLSTMNIKFEAAD